MYECVYFKSPHENKTGFKMHVPSYMSSTDFLPRNFEKDLFNVT